MSLKKMICDTKSFFEECKALHKKVVSGASKNISNQEQRISIESLAEKWFSFFSKSLPMYGVSSEVINKYNEAFKAILKLSSGPNRRESYKKHFDKVISTFNSDVIIFLQTDGVDQNEESHIQFTNEVQDILKKIPDRDDNEFLQEAMGCWRDGYLKGATVLLWCAAIDRIHKVIENIGFNKFNQTCEYMRAQTSGKYKRFNKIYNVQSLSDLRTVFDRDVLWALEEMQLIDSNERTRLISCFDMRCHSGHPGAAPITKYNVISCFSDIVEIVLANPKFVILKENNSIG